MRGALSEHMTNQELLNKIYNALVLQDAPSISAGGECQYRGPDGKKCAAGFVLPDEYYSGDFEGLGVGEPHMRSMFQSAGFDSDNIALIKVLQEAHDLWADQGLSLRVKVSDALAGSGDPDIAGLEIPPGDSLYEPVEL